MNIGEVSTFVWLFLCSIVTAASGTSSGNTCCDLLQKEFSNSTYLKDPIPTIKYLGVLDNYLSNTNKLAASCFIQPGSVNQVSRIVSILAKGQCLFAVKGGGASTVPGASDIDDGVTVDLSKLSKITLSPDNKTVTVQGGARWGDVYAALDSTGYNVPGALGINIGVGGLTLGGGMNNYMSRYGWTSGLVKNFEIVLGNGTLINASLSTNVDLFKALKGGGQGNFGIVTQIDFTAVKVGPIWGGVTIYDFKDVDKFYKPFVETTDKSAEQPDGGFLLAWINNATTGKSTVGTYLQYIGNATEKRYYTHTDTPTPQSQFPEAFSAFSFQNVGIPATNNLRIDSTYNWAREITTGPDQRILIGNVFFKADTQILSKVDRIAQEILGPYLNKTKPYPYNFVQIEYQPLPRIVTNISDMHGGNVLGLERVQSNAIAFFVWFAWSDPTQDSIIQNLTDTMLTEIAKYTKSVPGASIDFQYIGLATANQDPIGSYGQKNVDYLKQVSKKYDPSQVFQELVPGGFKLGDAGSKGKKSYNFNQFTSAKGN